MAKAPGKKPSKTLAPTRTLEQEEHLYDRIAAILQDARSRMARTVNTAMVHAYWLIGREIVLVEQRGERRAAYGEQLLEKLGKRLSKQFGRGMGVATLRRARSFFQTFPEGSALAPEMDAEIRSTALIEWESNQKRSAPSIELEQREALSLLFPSSLSWSHYLVLLRVSQPDARSFYEIEAARESWSVRELERQVAALLFERLSRNKNPEQVIELARKGLQISVPSDVLKDPFVLEFADIRENPSAHERDLEQAIIDRLEDFLLEMGKGFCFVARQKRVTLDGDHFYVDLVFYNRLLRCFVLVDLKLGKLTHQDLGQMQMYVNFFDRFHRVEHEEKTIGIVLCSDKNDAMVRITLPDGKQRVLATRYQMYLPTEEELRARLEREREAAERELRLTAEDLPTPGDCSLSPAKDE